MLSIFPPGSGRALGALLLFGWNLSCGRSATTAGESRAFDPDTDLLSLHYDHAPDQDDGHSAAADRMILETERGADWIGGHVVAVSGTYGENASSFDSGSDAVMDAAWNDAGGWLAAHAEPEAVRRALAERWLETLEAGGDIWIKEGGQSDITADVVRTIRERAPDIATAERIHVVQHSDWNEEQTTDADLAYTREHTDYIRIRDANAYLNVEGGDAAFEADATGHTLYGPVWQAAFAYYDPGERLDFSDTGELMHILGLGELGIDDVRVRYLANANAAR